MTFFQEARKGIVSYGSGNIASDEVDTWNFQMVSHSLSEVHGDIMDYTSDVAMLFLFFCQVFPERRFTVDISSQYKI